VPRPPSVVGNVTGGSASGRNAIPIILKQKTVLGADPYNSLQPTTPELLPIPKAAKVVDENAPTFRVTDTPDLGTGKLALPEAPPIEIE
jgi:hypothetical protein